MNKYIAPFFFVAVIGNVQATEITETHVTGTRFKFTAKLDAPLIVGNKVKIEFGKNLVPMTCVETTCTLFRTMNSDVMPAYKIGIYNSKNVLQVAEIHTATQSYTKIANDGSELSDSAKLGSSPKDWACTKDNKTGLIWEVKTSDGGLRDSGWTYSWYEPDVSKNGGFEGYRNLRFGGYEKREGCKGSDCDTAAFTKAVNSQMLCGANDWRIPTNEELKGLVYCSDGKAKILGKEESGSICIGSPSIPTIDTIYFPTPPIWEWSSTSDASGFSVWIVHFDLYGDTSTVNKSGSSGGIRLVRNAQ